MNNLHSCNNCGLDFEKPLNFCPRCGQKNTDGRISIWVLLKDFLQNTFNFDSRLLVTIRDIFIPGKLTKQYFEGKHKTYVNPFQLFFFTTVICITLIGFFINPSKLVRQQMESQDMMGSFMGVSEKEQNVFTEDSLVVLEEILKGENPVATEEMLPDTLVLVDSSDQENRDTTTIISKDSVNVTANIGFLEPLFMSKNDLREMDPDQLVERYQVKGFQKIWVRQQLRLIKQPERLVEFFLAHMVWMLLLFIPVIALLLKLLYIRRNRYYVEHLIFSLHLHTVGVVLITMGILINLQIFNLRLMLLLFAIFLFVALKVYYGQGYFKTFLKFIIINFFYPVLFSLFFAAGSLLSLALF